MIKPSDLEAATGENARQTMQRFIDDIDSQLEMIKRQHAPVSYPLIFSSRHIPEALQQPIKTAFLKSGWDISFRSREERNETVYSVSLSPAR
jgi:hypothetical protein